MKSLAQGETMDMRLGDADAFAGVETKKEYSEAYSNTAPSGMCPSEADQVKQCSTSFDVIGAMGSMNVDGVSVSDGANTSAACVSADSTTRRFLGALPQDISETRPITKTGSQNHMHRVDTSAGDFEEKIDIIRRLAPAHKTHPGYYNRKQVKSRKLEAAIANGNVGNLHVDKLSRRLNFKRSDFASEKVWLENRDFALDHDIDEFTKKSLRKLAVEDPHNRHMIRLMSMPLEILRRALQESDLQTDMPASCYTSVQKDNKYVGQLVGDCLKFSPSVPLNAATSVTFKVLPDIARNPVFTQIDLGKQVTSSTGSILLEPLGTTSATLEATGEKMTASIKDAGTYCPIMRYPTYIGEKVTSANNTCANLDAINVAIAAQVREFGKGSCRSFDCAFGSSGTSASLGSNGKVGNVVSHLLSAADTRTTTLAPGTTYFLVTGVVTCTFTIPDSDTAVTLMANSKFTSMLVSGLATALTQPKSMVSLTGLQFSARRQLSTTGRDEVTVTLGVDSVAMRHILEAQLAEEKKARNRVRALENAYQNAIYDSERTRLSSDVKHSKRYLDATMSAHKRKLGEQAIDTSYQVRVADSAAGNALLAMIASGSATSFENALKAAIENLIASDPELAASYAVLGVVSKGGSIQQAVEGADANASEGTTPKVKDSAYGNKSFLRSTALIGLLLVHAIYLYF
jgi:hypothetical protein